MEAPHIIVAPSSSADDCIVHVLRERCRSQFVADASDMARISKVRPP